MGVFALMKDYARILVYDYVRPLAVGGIDFKSIASSCMVTESDRVFDFGCGSGSLLPYLRYESYLGTDVDGAALRRAMRYAGPRTRFFEGDGWDDLYRELKPTVVLMIGVVHHLADDEFRSVIRRLKVADPPPRLVTIDVSFFPDMALNNYFSSKDRGKFVRKPEGYETLFTGKGLKITGRKTLSTRLGYVRYLVYYLEFEEGAGAGKKARGNP
jgi:SAM-dependent methyltransferase